MWGCKVLSVIATSKVLGITMHSVEDRECHLVEGENIKSRILERSSMGILKSSQVRTHKNIGKNVNKLITETSRNKGKCRWLQQDQLVSEINLITLASNMVFILCLINAIFYAMSYQTATVQRCVMSNIKHLETVYFTSFPVLREKN